jgi:hypothetical protein
MVLQTIQAEPSREQFLLYIRFCGTGSQKKNLTKHIVYNSPSLFSYAMHHTVSFEMSIFPRFNPQEYLENKNTITPA